MTVSKTTAEFGFYVDQFRENHLASICLSEYACLMVSIFKEVRKSFLRHPRSVVLNLSVSAGHMMIRSGLPGRTSHAGGPHAACGP